MNMKLQSSNKFLESAFAWAVNKTAAGKICNFMFDSDICLFYLEKFNNVC